MVIKRILSPIKKFTKFLKIQSTTQGVGNKIFKNTNPLLFIFLEIDFLQIRLSRIGKLKTPKFLEFSVEYFCVIFSPKNLRVQKIGQDGSQMASEKSLSLEPFGFSGKKITQKYSTENS